MNVFIRRLGLAAAALSLAVAPRVSAQALPDAKDLIQKYSKAVGGEAWKSHKSSKAVGGEAWKSHKSARMKATLEMPGGGLKPTSKP